MDTLADLIRQAGHCTYKPCTAHNKGVGGIFSPGRRRRRCCPDVDVCPWCPRMGVIGQKGRVIKPCGPWVHPGWAGVTTRWMLPVMGCRPKESSSRKVEGLSPIATMDDGISHSGLRARITSEGKSICWWYSLVSTVNPCFFSLSSSRTPRQPPMDLGDNR
jgi:hypothetical protein